MTRVDSVYRFEGDTLFIDPATKIYVGESLVIGQGTGARDWYLTIGFKTLVNFPVLFMQGTEIRNNPDYQSYPQHRTNDKLKESLVPGEFLTITKIQRQGKMRHGYWYKAILKSKQFPWLRYYCDLIKALQTKELSVQK